MAESLAKSTDVFFHVTISGHKYITKPEGMLMLFEPGGGAQGLLIAAAREVAMAFGVELLDVEQYKVNLVHKLLDVLVPYAAIGVNASVYAVALEVAHKRYQSFGLYGGLATREGDTATLAEEGYLAHGHIDNLFRTCSLAAIEVDGVRVGTVEATEGTALKENDEPETRPVECPHTFVGVYVYHLYIEKLRIKREELECEK